MRNKKLLILGLSVPVLVLAVLGVAVFLIPTDRVAAMVEARAEAFLRREVEVGGVSLRVFPRPAVALEALAVGGATEDAPPLATVRRVLLRPRLLPLLSKQVVVDEIIIDSPRLLVEVDSAGQFASAAERRVEDAKEGGDATFLVRKIEVRDGRLGYRERDTGTAVRLDGYDQRLSLSGVVRGGKLAEITLEGELSVDAVSANLPGRLGVPIRDVRVEVAHDGTLDLAADSVRLTTLAVRIQEVLLQGAGVVHGVSSAEAREVMLELEASPFDVGALVRSLPAGLLAIGDGPLPSAEGRAAVKVRAVGRLGAGEIPVVNGMLALHRVALAYGTPDPVLSELTGDVTFSFDSVFTQALEGELLGAPLHVGFMIRDLAEPVAEAEVRTAIDLGLAAARGLVPDSLGVRGRIHVDVAASAPLDDPARGTVDGTIGLDGVVVRAPTLLQEVEVPSGRLAFDGGRVQAGDVRVRFGESSLSLDVDVDGWLPLALGDTTTLAKARFDVWGETIDLDALLGVPDSALYSTLLFARLADREVDGRAVEEVAEEAGLGLPTLPPAEIDGRLRAKVLRRNGLELRDVDVTLTGRGDRLEISDARFQFLGGGVQIAGRVGMPAGAEAEGLPATLTFQLQDVGAGPFFDRFTPFRDHLTGSLLLAGTAQVVLDRHLLPMRESVMAEGAIAVTEGQLANWPALRILGEKLGTLGFDTLTFRDWAGNFRITGPRITLNETALESGEMDVRAAGSIDFGGRLDLTATLLLSPELASRVRGDAATHLVAAVADAEGRVPVGLRILGPAASPSLSLDFSAAVSNAVDRARAEAEAKAREMAEEAAEGLLQRFLPGDSLKQQTDSTRTRVQTEVKNRLCRIVKCE